MIAFNYDHAFLPNIYRISFVLLLLQFLIETSIGIASPLNGNKGNDPAQKESFNWLQWRGPGRNGISLEKGLIESFPKDGPERVWRREIGTSGYSGIVVKDEYLYTMYSEGDYEYVICLDALTGAQVWVFVNDNIFLNQHGRGPRSTPIFDDDKLFFLGAKGNFYALNAYEKKVHWHVNLQDYFRGNIPRWGYTASPIIVDDLLLVEAQTLSGNLIAAFNKNDGALEWTTKTGASNYSNADFEHIRDYPGYSSPIFVNLQKQEQIVFFSGTRLQAVTPKGKLLWSHLWLTRNNANVATPISLPDNKIFISSGYNKGAALIEIQKSDNEFQASEAWRSNAMECAFSSPIYIDNYIYGFDTATLKCIDPATGEQMWKKFGLGQGSLIYADGKLIVLSEFGDLLFIKPTPQKYLEISKAKLTRRGKCWTPPALANGKLYLRNQFEIHCLELRKNSTSQLIGHSD